MRVVNHGASLPAGLWGLYLARGGVFVPALSQPMTRDFERPMVGVTHIEEGMPQKNRTKKAFDHT